MLSIQEFYKAKAMLEAASCCKPSFVIYDDIIPEKKSKFSFKKTPSPVLVDCPKAQPWPVAGCEFATKTSCQKEEGNNPMRYNDNYASATANVSAPKSDLAVSRDYFVGRLKEVRNEVSSTLSDTFNLHKDNSPKNFNQLIEAIKGGKYTIDKKIQKQFDALDEDEQKNWYYGAFNGIIWEGPKQDWSGYEKAVSDLSKQEADARDAIMAAATAGDMKAAVEAFKSWTPTVGSTTSS